MTPLVSIIIDNYNYAKFLPAAIESAIHQTYSPVEILVVDDGSTDESREIIARYQSSIVPILKRNGGNNSAINAGVKHSHGKIICFLDADDFYHPDKVQGSWRFLKKNLASQNRCWSITSLKYGMNLATKRPVNSRERFHGSPYNLYDHARRYRFIPFETGPTSSISINRALADLLFPLPEHRVKMWADDFIVLGASLVSELRSLNSGLGGYRVHGGNLWFNLDRTKTYESIEILEELKRKADSQQSSTYYILSSFHVFLGTASKGKTLANAVGPYG